jgi:hypothetical protein
MRTAHALPLAGIRRGRGVEPRALPARPPVARVCVELPAARAPWVRGAASGSDEQVGEGGRGWATVGGRLAFLATRCAA